MTKFYFLRTVLVTAAFLNIFIPAKAQNYLTQSFDGSGIPSGWSNAIYTSPSSCGVIYGCIWNRVPGGTGNPGPATHSGAGYMFYNADSIHAGGTAELATPALDFSTYSTGYNQVSFWMYRDFETGPVTYYDSIAVYVNTSASSSGGTMIGSVIRDASLVPTVSASGWYRYTYQIPPSFSGSTNYIIFRSFSDSGYDIYLDDVSVDHIPPCSGYPSITGTSPAGPLYTCLGAVDTLTVNTPYATGLHFQWQLSRDTGLTWLDIINDTTQSTVVLSQKTVLYRAKVTCTASSSTSTATPVSIFVNSGGVVKYAGLSYTQKFESWSDNCGTHDRPDSSWTISPATGNGSWRRDDEGFTYASWGGSSGVYSPAYFEGSHSARFHSNGIAAGTVGEMELYVDCSADTVHGKELRFYYMNNAVDADNLQIMMSVDSGLTFSSIGSLAYVRDWTRYIIPFNAKRKTVFRFIGMGNSGYDMGIDKLQIIPPCSGKPAAGTVIPVTACAGSYFNLTLVGTTEAADLKYQWQSSSDSSSWSNIAGDTLPSVPAVISSNTYFRAIVKCAVSGQSDTSAGYKVILRPFYYCYCMPNNPWNVDIPQDNIGNVSINTSTFGISVLNNGSASPITNNSTAVNSYSNFDSSITSPVLFLDTSYAFFVTAISQYSSLTATPVDIFIDFDHNGSFDASDHIPSRFIYSASSPTVTDTFTIPHTALLGLTGMRVKLGVSEASPTDPCITIPAGSTTPTPDIFGEYEDYLVDIEYFNCHGPVNPGRVQSTDTLACNGAAFILSDTSHEHHQAGISWNWQYSLDSTDWYDVAGSTKKDSIIQTFSGSIWYRVRMLCPSFNDTTYSDTLHIRLRPPYRCYCASYADGGNARDTGDIGSFSINGFLVNKGGPHLNNPAAVYSLQDYSNSIIDLWVDSVYTVNVYYILHHDFESYAKLTMFIDYNNDFQYDIPTERVWTAVTSSSAPSFLSANIHIPLAAVTGAPTGMRLIINNDTAANTPSDYACGSYTSGETMDFALRFGSHVDVPNTNYLQNIGIFPNPTSGKFILSLYAAEKVDDLEITVTDMMGRQLRKYNYKNTTGDFRTSIDLSDQPKGMYFVQLITDNGRLIRKLVLN
jgi:hypothetical protein